MQLSYQHHDWWWRSFTVGGSGGIYIFIYCIYYLMAEMKLGSLSSDATFLIYVFVFIVCYTCAAGFISVMASYYFVSNIYKDVSRRTD